MRKLVEEKIRHLYWVSGYKDVGLSGIMYYRERKNLPKLEHVIGGTFDFPFIVGHDIELLLPQLTDDEVLEVLDNQLCDKYR